MNTRLRLIYLILFTLICSTSFADEKQIIPPKKANAAVGLNAGWVIGNGLIYRKYQGNHIYQVTFAGLINKDEKEEYLNLSLSYARYLNKFDYSTPIGLKWVIGGEAVYDKTDNVSDNGVNIGSGIGIDIGRVMQPGITLSFDLIYTASFNGLKNPEFNALDLRPSIGLLYNF